MSASDEHIPEELLRSPVRGTGSWTPTRDSNGRGRRRFLRIAFSVLGIGTLGALLYLLTEPFTNPDLHLVAISLGPGESEAVATRVDGLARRVDYQYRDLEALQSLGERLHQYDENHPPTIFRGIRTSADVPALGKRITESIRGKSNVVLIYLTASGIADGETPRLQWRLPGRLAPPQQGTIQQFVEQLPRDATKVKLLLLDIQPPSTNRRVTPVADAFPRLLRSAVESSGDKSLWVLASHSTFETSHSDPHLRRGLFGFFVVRGLSGAADLDDDGSVSLRELHAYVSSTVSAWVNQQTSFRASQTPMLIWGGGPHWPRTLPELIPTLTPRSEFASVVPDPDESEAEAAVLAAQKLFPPDLNLTKAAESIAVRRRERIPLKPFPRAPDLLTTPAPQENAAASEEQQSAAPGGDGAAKTAAAKPAKTTPENAEEPQNETRPAASIAARIAGTWKLRDELLDRRVHAVTPLDDAPHLWRELEARLIACETAYRSFGPFPKPKSGTDENQEETKPIPQHHAESITRTLNEIQRLMRILADREGKASPTAGQNELRIVRYVSKKRPIVTDPRSLGLAEWLDRRGDRRLTAEERQSLERFDRLVDGGSRQALNDAVKKLTPGDMRQTEWQLAASFSRRPRIDWPSVRMALAVRRYGEQVAASSMGRLAWVRELIASADSHRRDGERRLRDQIGADFASSARSELIVAARTYQRAADRLAGIDALQNDTRMALHRLPGDLAFWQSAAVGPAERRRAHDRLASLIGTLGELARLLDAPTGKDRQFEIIRRLHRRLISLNGDLQRMTAQLRQDDTATSPARSEVASNELTQRLNILSSSRLSAEERLGVLKGIPQAAFAAARSVRLPHSILAPAETPASSLEDWQRTLRWASLQASLAELTAIDEGSFAAQERPATGSQPTRIGAAFKAFQSAVASSGATLSAADENRLWETHRRFAAELSQYYRTLPSRIAATSAEAARRTATSPAGRAGLARAERALRLLGPRDAVKLGNRNLPEQIRQHEVLALLSWLRSRAVAARRDAHESDLALLGAQAAAYGEQIAAVTGGTPPVDTTRLSLQGPRVVDLTDSPVRDVEIETELRGEQSTRAWRVLEYDPEILEVELFEGEAAIDMAALRSSPNRGLYPYRSLQPATIVLKPGRKSVLRFRLRRLKPTLSNPTRLVVRAITGDEYKRKTIAVRLPSPEILVVEAAVAPAAAGAASERNDGVNLHPFPNRDTDFTLALRNAGQLKRVVDVQLLASSGRFPADFPIQELNDRRASQQLARLKPFQVIATQAKVEIPENGDSIKLELAAPAQPKTAQNDQNAEQAAAGTKLARDLVLVIRDPQTKGAFFRRIRFAPQRPRRFLRPKLAYDRLRRVIQVELSPYDVAALPSEPVKVTAELRPTGVAREPLLAEGEISRDAPRVSLSLPLPARAERVVEVQIHVDGFPRAFLYRLATDRSAVDLPELSGRRRIRIVEPAGGIGLSPKTKSFKAVVEVDAPIGSFQDSDDFVEIGIDVNRDRRLEGDPVQRFQNDRQIDLRLRELTADGGLKIGCAVSDFHLTFTPAALNQRVNLIGRLVAERNTAWSSPVELILDGTPPEVLRLRNVVGTVEKPFGVNVNVTDGGLSGVDKVEFLLDVGRLGVFPAEAAPAIGEPGALGNWSATVDPGKTPPGTYTLLVRAIDRVGNVSKTAKTRVRLLSKAEAAAGATGSANRISGVVTFDKSPIDGATVSLEPKASAPAGKTPPAAKTAAKIEDTTTDEQGRFTFVDVPPGDYILTVKKRAVANKNRKVQLPIKVEPKPAFIPLQRIKLR